MLLTYNKPGVYVMIVNAGGESKYSMRIILYNENMRYMQKATYRYFLMNNNVCRTVIWPVGVSDFIPCESLLKIFCEVSQSFPT